jgi:hypothetical protein
MYGASAQEKTPNHCIVHRNQNELISIISVQEKRSKTKMAKHFTLILDRIFELSHQSLVLQYVDVNIEGRTEPENLAEFNPV